MVINLGVEINSLSISWLGGRVSNQAINILHGQKIIK